MGLKTLRLQLRFLLPLVVTLVVAAYLAVPLMDQVTLRWFSRDLNSRGVLVANALSDSVADALHRGPAGTAATPVRPRGAGRAPVRDRPVRPGRPAAAAHGPVPRRPDLRGRRVELAQRAEPRLALAGGAVHVGVHDVIGSDRLRRHRSHSTATVPRRRRRAMPRSDARRGIRGGRESSAGAGAGRAAAWCCCTT